MHAFEVFEDIAPVITPRAVELCDWLDSVTLPDGGLPFALPVADAVACAPFWAEADHTVSTLQSTAFAAGAALRVAAHDSAVAAHPWPARASQYCFDAIDALGNHSRTWHGLTVVSESRPAWIARHGILAV